ncbi:BMP family lipoprotein [Haloprofundus salinisoli]|uniref:BMP family lipoprotein n=1 Tax=Haloprofundus salinisoli TaxID=2876193 RepID=UPI001CD02385|nr:BMP family ABC transporter substrate-binding protein [Haloprofundus salinisoli]
MTRREKTDAARTESKTLTRRSVLASGAVLGATAVAGCLGGGGGGGGGGENGYNAAIISSPAGFDDNAFNDNALEGLEQAAEEFDLEVNSIEETQEAQYESVQADTAEAGYDLIVMVGDHHTGPLETNASEYPDQNWMLINNVIDGADNVSGWIEMNNEMSFLAGVAAGTMTQEDYSEGGGATNPDESVVGFVGGEDIPLINAFEQSYIEGAEWVNENVEVLTGYSGTFSDTAPANNLAESQIDQGADIVWHAASAAGAGVFSAAQDNERYALGVDVDQSVTEEQYQDVIIGSAVKALNEATYTVVEAVINDNFSEFVGENNLSIEQESIDFITGQALGDSLPEVLSTNIEDAKQAIVDGDVELSCGPTRC